MPDTSVALEARNISRRFGAVTALDNVSIQVAHGECVAITGESGSGKTTLLHCFNRRVEPDSGSIAVGGKDVRDTDVIRLRRHIGYVPQDGGLLPHWSVLRNVALVPALNNSPDPLAAARNALHLVSLDPDTFAHRRPSQLSGGQRQRVAIARALADRPGLVLLDEPFGALDAITRADLQNAFLQLHSEIRFTALLVTHDLHEAGLLATRIAILRAGRIEQLDPLPAILNAPATPWVAQLLQRARLRLP